MPAVIMSILFLIVGVQSARAASDPALAALVAASGAWPIHQVWRNDGPLRRKLWQGIGA